VGRDTLGGVTRSTPSPAPWLTALALPSLFLSRFACETGDASDMLTVAMHSAVYGVGSGWSWRPRADGYVLAAEVSRQAAK
jgi:hypothetical protein